MQGNMKIKGNMGAAMKFAPDLSQKTLNYDKEKSIDMFGHYKFRQCNLFYLFLIK